VHTLRILDTSFSLRYRFERQVVGGEGLGVVQGAALDCEVQLHTEYGGKQLEMWQAETFDIENICRELWWAGDLGFNTAHIYILRRDSVPFIATETAFIKKTKGRRDRMTP
jgi:hypothetical protein